MPILFLWAWGFFRNSLSFGLSFLILWGWGLFLHRQLPEHIQGFVSVSTPAHGPCYCKTSTLSTHLLSPHLDWKATKEYLNQRGTKIRVFRVLFRAPFLPPFSPHFSPSFPFGPCSLSHHFPPLHLPLLPPCFDSQKTPI